MRRKQSGFTLIELMVTVATVAILAAVAIPSYRQYVRRAAREDATAALLKLAAAQEKFYIQNNTYASNALLTQPPPAGLGITHTDRDFYTLALAPAAGGYAAGYTATAAVAAGGDQADDAECGSFTINDQGLRGAADSGGATSQVIIDRCWR